MSSSVSPPTSVYAYKSDLDNRLREDSQALVFNTSTAGSSFPGETFSVLNTTEKKAKARLQDARNVHDDFITRCRVENNISPPANHSGLATHSFLTRSLDLIRHTKRENRHQIQKLVSEQLFAAAGSAEIREVNRRMVEWLLQTRLLCQLSNLETESNTYISLNTVLDLLDFPTFTLQTPPLQELPSSERTLRQIKSMTLASVATGALTDYKEKVQNRLLEKSKTLNYPQLAADLRKLENHAATVAKELAVACANTQHGPADTQQYRNFLQSCVELRKQAETTAETLTPLNLGLPDELTVQDWLVWMAVAEQAEKEVADKELSFDSNFHPIWHLAMAQHLQKVTSLKPETGDTTRKYVMPDFEQINAALHGLQYLSVSHGSYGLASVEVARTELTIDKKGIVEIGPGQNMMTACIAEWLANSLPVYIQEAVNLNKPTKDPGLAVNAVSGSEHVERVTRQSDLSDTILNAFLLLMYLNALGCGESSTMSFFKDATQRLLDLLPNVGSPILNRAKTLLEKKLEDTDFMQLGMRFENCRLVRPRPPVKA